MTTSFKDKYQYDPNQPISTDECTKLFKARQKTTRQSVLILQYSLPSHSAPDYEAKKAELAVVRQQILKIQSLPPHKNIATVFEVMCSDQLLIAAMEDCERGTLMNFVKKEKFLDQKLVLFMCRQVSQGLVELHKRGIIHSYINMENIELDNQGNWKISMRALVFKAYYLSPQFKESHQRTKEGDVFSLGTAIYKALYGVFPFSGKTNQEIIQNVRRGERRSESVLNELLPMQIIISKSVESLLVKMIDYKPSARPLLDMIILVCTEALKESMTSLSNTTRKLPLEVEQDYAIFQFSDKIQRGGFPVERIYTGVDRRSGDLVKIKLVEGDFNRQDPDELRAYEKRVQYFSKNQQIQDISRRHFAKIIENNLSKNSLTIIYEYFNQGTLEEYNQKRKAYRNLDEAAVQEIGYYISDALLQYESDNSEPYWSLSPSRVFIKQGKLRLAEPVLETQTIKKKMHESRNTIDFLSPEKKKNALTDGAILKDQLAVQDTWSLGCSLYYILAGSLPAFDYQNSLLFTQSVNISSGMKKKLAYMLSFEAQDRSCLAQIEFAAPSSAKLAKYLDISKDEAKKFATKDRKEPKLVVVDTRLQRSTLKRDVIDVLEPQKQSAKTNKHGSKITAKKGSKLDSPRQNRRVKQDESEVSRSLSIGIRRKNNKVKEETLNIDDEIDLTEKMEGSATKMGNNQGSDDQDGQEDCFQRSFECLSRTLTLKNLDEAGYFQIMQESFSRKPRYIVKILLSIMVYFVLFYMSFCKISGTLLADRNFYSNVSITTRRNANDSVPTVNFSVVTTNTTYFKSYYNTTLSKIKVDMDCCRDNYYDPGSYGDKLYVNDYLKSGGFVFFQITGFLLMCVHLFLKGAQICKLDFIRMVYKSRREKNHDFNIVLAYIYIEIGMSSFISVHYLLYGSLYHFSLEPCLQNPLLPSIQKLFSGWVGSFVLMYIWQYIGLAIAYGAMSYFLFKKQKKTSNLVWVLLFLLYLAGVGTRGMGGVVSSKGSTHLWISAVGVCGELLELIVMILCGFVDLLCWKILKSSTSKKSGTAAKELNSKTQKHSSSSSNKSRISKKKPIMDDSNATLGGLNEPQS